jgi:tetratricopeptide (TPR) repeat protein
MVSQNALKAPAVDKALLQQAHTLFQQRKYAGAVSLYRKLLEQERNDVLIWGNLGICLRNLHHYDSALACLKRADALSPNAASILRHIATCLCLLNRKAESLETFAKVYRLSPDDFNTHAFYAFALQALDMNAEALPHYKAALAQDPAHVETRWQYAQALLRLGRYKEGWKEFESRWKLDKNSPFWLQAEQEKTFTSKRWMGEDLSGKTILIYAEQGFGDTILASRYIPLVKARGGRIIFGCKPPLHRLLHKIPGIDKLVGDDAIGEKIDYHAPLMSLPGIFRTEISSIPPVAPLYVPETMPAEAARLLGFAQNRFKVGIVWTGNPNFTSNAKRAVPLSRFLPLAEIPGVQLYSLQKGPNEQELVDCGAQGLIPELGPHLNDFADTAAVLKNLDLVIMTDSSVAHLAGSLGVPVWNLLSTGAYWLYLLNREDSPWYPSMRLFRQPEPGDWKSVFERVATELAKAVALKK